MDTLGQVGSNPGSNIKSPTATVMREEIKELEIQENQGEEKEGPQAEAKEVEQQINLMAIKHEPGKLDLAYEQAIDAQKAVDNIINKKYLIFRPYIDPMTMRPYKAADKGYFFKFYKGDGISLIRYTLEDNGFREVTEKNQEFSVMWACRNIQSEVYLALNRNQKVNHFPKS